MEVFDAVVVGSGPVGSAFVRVISDLAPQARVLLVEAGPKLGPVPGEHVLNLPARERAQAQQSAQGAASASAHAEPPFVEAARAGQPGADPGLLLRPGLSLIGTGRATADEYGMIGASAATGVGGMGVLWSGSCPRPSGSEVIGFIPRDQLDKAFEEAERLLRVSVLGRGDPLLTRLVEQLGTEFDGDGADAPSVQLTPFAATVEADGLRLSGTSVILGDALDRESVELRTETLCRSVLVEDGAVVGAILEDRVDGRVYEVRAARVVVACDGLRTSQLLFASGIRPPALGHYLNDHLKMFGTAQAVGSPLGGEGVGAVLIPFAEGVRRYQGQVHPDSRNPVLIAARDADRRSGEEALAERDEGLCRLGWFGSKEIRFEDRVEFSDTALDEYGMPAMTIHYDLTEADRALVESMRDDAGRAAAAIGALVVAPVLMPSGSSVHYQGANRMGLDPADSVCDSYSRVWNTTGLYIGGNGVIPTGTACNPTLTSVALAVRAARDLVASWSTAPTEVHQGVLGD